MQSVLMKVLSCGGIAATVLMLAILVKPQFQDFHRLIRRLSNLERTLLAGFLLVLVAYGGTKPPSPPPVPPSASCTISFVVPGWHEMSCSALPEGGSPEDVFAAVSNEVGYVTRGSANWSPADGGTLAELEFGKGYWVRTIVSNVTWTVTGETDPTVEIALKPGWNLIGYPLLEEGEVETVLATALATGKIVYISSGSLVYPGALVTLVPGRGYWVYVREAVTIRFDDE